MVKRPFLVDGNNLLQCLSAYLRSNHANSHLRPERHPEMNGNLIGVRIVFRRGNLNVTGEPAVAPQIAPDLVRSARNVLGLNVLPGRMYAPRSRAPIEWSDASMRLCSAGGGPLMRNVPNLACLPGTIS